MSEFYSYVIEFKGFQKALRTGNRGKWILENAKNARGNLIKGASENAKGYSLKRKGNTRKTHRTRAGTHRVH